MGIVVAILAFAAGVLVAVAVALTIRRESSPATVPPESVPDRTPPRKPESRVLEALDLGVVLVDRDEQVVLANPVAHRMAVIDADRLALPILSDLVRSVLDSAVSATATITLASTRRGPDLATYLVRAAPLGPADVDSASGRIPAVVLQFTDVTEAQRVELVRRDFVANVSHELKTPVGALTLLAEAVLDAADDPEAVQRFAARMQREGARLGRLVGELIDLSRLQGAEPLPGDEVVSVADVVAESLDRSHAAAERAGILVVRRSTEDLYVSGSEAQLTTALSNLIDNAIAYSPERTRVGVTAKASADGRWVELSVSDQGIGISEPELDRVFERFYRVDPARSRATGGTGLGLAIVKHIATNHGGSVSVWSLPGAGSTFTVKLPRAAAPEDYDDVDVDDPRASALNRTA